MAPLLVRVLATVAVLPAVVDSFLTFAPAIQHALPPSVGSSSRQWRQQTQSLGTVPRRHGTVSRLVVKAAWGDPVEMKSVKIVSNEAAGSVTRRLKIEVPEDIIASFTDPGQYVQMKQGSGKVGYYAMLNAPDPKSKTLEFLVKGSETNNFLVQAKEGTTVEMSAACGKGFPIEENFEGYKYAWPVQNVLLVATGTGVAPIASVISSKVLVVDTEAFLARACKLYYGSQSEDTIPIKEELKQWEETGIEVVIVLSQPGPGWTGRTGYVQDAIKEDGIIVPRNSGIVMCGQKEMTEELKAFATSLNVFEGRCLTNF